MFETVINSYSCDFEILSGGRIGTNQSGSLNYGQNLGTSKHENLGIFGKII
jgi:hypothetical protein